MANYTINRSAVSKKLVEAMKSELPKVDKALAANLKTQKDKLLNNLDKNDISIELSVEDPESHIPSLMLEYGNLFSYLGFNQGDQPYSKLRNYMSNSIKISKKLEIKKVTNDRLYYTYSVSLPSEDQIYKKTKLPWQKNNSWVRIVEKTGLDNFGHFLFTIEKELKKSRSTTGLQIKQKLNDSKNLDPSPYVINELNELKKGLTKNRLKL